VTVPYWGRGRPRIDVHVTRQLHQADRTSVGGIPVTSVARTLLDLAETISPTQLRRAYEQAERLRILDVGAIRSLLARSNGRRGVAALRALLEYDPSPASETRSELESLFLDLVREAGLPLPNVNVMVEGFEVDAYWPDAKLVVELQGYRNHSHPRAFERDHTKVARLKRAGCDLLPLTWRQLATERAFVAELIRTLRARSHGSLDRESVV
jgi:very-short-patch-repair endonuclease